MDNLRIAVVKSSVYPDLWVNDITNDFIQVFKTSIMRCPPIGLTECFSTDFIIVKDTNEFPCNINKNVFAPNTFNDMPFSKNLKVACLPFLDETYHKNITIDSVSHLVDDIEWNKYNIVICINTCIPERIISKFKEILWCYFVGENEDHYVNNIIGNYDIILNQDVYKKDLPNFSIGFPYSFIGPYTIENMMRNMNIKQTKKNGIFQEINNTTSRPVVEPHPDFFKIGNNLNMPINLHSQNIIENITRIYI